jgi:hypothetical protein
MGLLLVVTLTDGVIERDIAELIAEQALVDRGLALQRSSLFQVLFPLRFTLGKAPTGLPTRETARVRALWM